MIDDELKDALKVDPSPEFLARVRTRVASEPAPSAWRWSWTLAAAGALAAALVVAVIMSRPEQKIAPTPHVAQAFRPAAEAGPKGPALQAAPVAAAPTTRSATAFAPPVVSGFSRTVPTAAQPGILLDPAETRALRGLIAGVRDGRVDLAAVRNSVAPAPMALEPITDIVIAPITIEPIAPPSGAEGERP